MPFTISHYICASLSAEKQFKVHNKLNAVFPLYLFSSHLILFYLSHPSVSVSSLLLFTLPNTIPLPKISKKLLKEKYFHLVTFTSTVSISFCPVTGTHALILIKILRWYWQHQLYHNKEFLQIIVKEVFRN